MSYRQSDTACLNCDNVAMGQVTNQGISYRRCDGCQSVWIGRNAFRSLMQVHHPEGDSDLLIHNDGTKRRPCPVCAVTMDIGWMLFLQMEQCGEHGIWFDPGELASALAGEVGGEVLKQVQARTTARSAGQAQSAGWMVGFLGFFG